MNPIRDSERKPYLDDRVIYDRGNHRVIMSENDVIPKMSCGCCERILTSESDVETSEKYDCCNDCYQRWVIDDVKRWMNGWRPNDKERFAIRKTLEVKINL